jgi:sphingomyelin phosphodiesterase 2
VRLATLNVWGLPWPFAREGAERMHAIGAALPALELDLAVFQEVWTEDARQSLREAGARAGLAHVWQNGPALGGSGLLVLSRLPISSAHFERFSVRGYPERVDHGDYYGGKGFLRISLEHPSGPISLVTTHLHARYASDVEHAYVPQRIAQIVQLASAIWSSEEPTLAVGDFKRQHGLAIYDPERERKLIERLTAEFLEEYRLAQSLAREGKPAPSAP